MGVTYKGDGAVKTRVGAFFTLAFYALALVNLKELITSLFDKSAQKEVYQPIKIDTYDMKMQNLADQNFNMAIISNAPIPKSIGRW